MNSQPFLSPRLTGARFEDHAIPLEFLKDLAVLEEMISEVARLRYLEDHPERKRTPRGFAKGVSLQLRSIEQGSARPIISLVLASSFLLPPGIQSYFESARDSIIGAIGEAEQNQKIELPEKVLSYFDRFGRSLRSGEALEFDSPTQSAPVRLTRESRRTLVLTAPSVKSVTDEIAVYGLVSAVDLANEYFNVELSEGRAIPAPLTREHFESVMEAFNDYLNKARVRIQGIGRFNRSNRLEKIESIEHIGIVDPLDVSARLDELKHLKKGWCDGSGLPLSPQGIDWLSSQFEEQYPDDLPQPYIYPTPSGGVQAEWSFPGQEISLEVNLTTHSGEWHVLNMRDNTEDSRRLDLNDRGVWNLLVGWIRESLEGAE